MPGTRRSVRVANCSGAAGDVGYQMYRQAVNGPVDVITGDYLAEVNLANSAEAYKQGKHTGWIPDALDGLTQTMKVAAEKGIKIVINGGALNPKGLAEKAQEIAREQGITNKIAYVDGDDLFDRAKQILTQLRDGKLSHLDKANSNVQLTKDSLAFLDNSEEMPLVSANAYLGYRAIKQGLDDGADVVICGRVADASPVIAAAAWWHQWSTEDYDELAGALVAGHLIECSSYGTGANFAGFYQYETEDLLDLAFPITEIAANGDSVSTKHESIENGIVTPDVIKCQLLYELQGNLYLNSDVKADITHVKIVEEGKDRVHVSGVKGYPPPPTTKLAIFYRAGYQCELALNGCGYAIDKKYDLQEMQVKAKLEEWDVLKDFDILEFQRVGVPQENPKSQLQSTTYLRMFAQARSPATLGQLMRAFGWNGMAHFAGMHCSLDFRTAAPKPFLGYYPAIIQQSELDEGVTILGEHRKVIGPPKKTEPLEKRDDYDTQNPVDLSSFGPTESRPIGDIALARSCDKGANVNFGIFVQTAEQWEWLKALMSKAQLKKMMGTDWQDWFHMERVEMPDIYAVHFVVYGPLGRGVSSSKSLDGLGKGFGEFIRAVHVDVPKKFL